MAYSQEFDKGAIPQGSVILGERAERCTEDRRRAVSYDSIATKRSRPVPPLQVGWTYRLFGELVGLTVRIAR